MNKLNKNTIGCISIQKEDELLETKLIEFEDEKDRIFSFTSKNEDSLMIFTGAESLNKHLSEFDKNGWKYGASLLHPTKNITGFLEQIRKKNYIHMLKIGKKFDVELISKATLKLFKTADKSITGGLSVSVNKNIFVCYLLKEAPYFGYKLFFNKVFDGNILLIPTDTRPENTEHLILNNLEIIYDTFFTKYIPN